MVGRRVLVIPGRRRSGARGGADAGALASLRYISRRMLRLDRPAMLALVDCKLARADGEYLVFALQGPVPRPRRALHSSTAPVGPEGPRERVVGPRPARHDAGGGHDAGSAPRADTDALLQPPSDDGDWVSSARWRASLAAHDRPRCWIELARDLEREGRSVEANAALAAARWLEPGTVEDEIAGIVRSRSAELPAGMPQQPSRTSDALRHEERRGTPWIGSTHPLAGIPSLIEHACDPNVSVRARIYRSLGQSAHPASIQTLHEGTLDPHPFARAQAARALGRIGDPTLLDRLRVMSEDDPEAEVRRTAASALQRIVGFWLHYGEWSAILGDPARCLEVARSLSGRGLPAMAYAVVMEVDYEARTPAHDALERELEPRALLRDVGAPSWRYSPLLDEAAAAERALGPEPSLDEIASATREPGAVGWEARRIMRSRGAGTIEQRRWHRATGWAPQR